MKKLVYFIIIFAMLLSNASCGHKIDGSSVEDMDPSENDVIEDENMIAVSESEAKENGGFYILSDNLFFLCRRVEISEIFLRRIIIYCSQMKTLSLFQN